MSCKICGQKDLFSEVTDEHVCSICKLKYIGGLTATPQRIQKIREVFNLKEGEYLKQNNIEEARKILRRK